MLKSCTRIVILMLYERRTDVVLMLKLHFQYNYRSESRMFIIPVRSGHVRGLSRGVKWILNSLMDVYIAMAFWSRPFGTRIWRREWESVVDVRSRFCVDACG